VMRILKVPLPPASLRSSGVSKPISLSYAT
jgi:hypothetical protein